MSWMAWTVPSVLFFVGIAVALGVMTVAEIKRPSVARRGHLGLISTRGDRFFISLLGAAFIHLAWLGLSELPVWWSSVLCLVLLVLTVRWG